MTSLHPIRLFALLLCMYLIAVPKQGYSQTDSVRTEYSQETPDKSDFKLKEKYEYFTRAHVEEKTLFKIGVSPSGGWGGFYGFVGSIVNSVAVERKVTAPFSVLLEVKNRFSSSGSLYNEYTFGINGGLRYYYAMNRRIQKGKSANNFSNNYLSLQSTNVVYSNRSNSLNKYSSLSLLWGVQRRLGRYGYLDFNIGPSFPIYSPLYKLRKELNMPPNRWSPGIEVNFAIGLGW